MAAKKKKSKGRGKIKLKHIRHRLARIHERIREKIKERMAVYAMVAALSLLVLYQGYVYASVYWFRPGYVDSAMTATADDLLFSYEITRYPSSVEVSKAGPDENITIGFVTDPWNLNFGVVPFNGSYVKRQVILFNPGDEKIKVSIVAFGSISPLVDVPVNDFVLGGGQSRTADVYLRTYTYPEGNYSGEIDVVVKKANNVVGSLFIQ